jgi:hypothetical protein
MRLEPTSAKPERICGTPTADLPDRSHRAIRKIGESAAILLASCLCCSAEPLPKLKVSENHRFLVRENGLPFFYLADTAWEIFHRLNRKDAADYLRIRAQQGFTAVQAVGVSPTTQGDPS